MPWKIITLFALIPVAAYWISRYFFYQKNKELHGKIDCRMTTQDLAQKISFTGKIPRLRKNKRTAMALADVLLDAAYEELKASHKSLVAIRRRADTFAQIVAPFAIMIAVFAMCVGRPASICIACAVLANALVAVMKFTSRGVAKHAAEHAMSLLRKARIPRKEDEGSIESCLRALTWK
jgi:ABC-type transport system involved in cytochrome bd biosynthesis fused ATPase/permease subunit